jgi:hypothetical protein
MIEIVSLLFIFILTLILISNTICFYNKRNFKHKLEPYYLNLSEIGNQDVRNIANQYIEIATNWKTLTEDNRRKPETDYERIKIRKPFGLIERE